MRFTYIFTFLTSIQSTPRIFVKKIPDKRLFSVWKEDMEWVHKHVSTKVDTELGMGLLMLWSSDHFPFFISKSKPSETFNIYQTLLDRTKKEGYGDLMAKYLQSSKFKTYIINRRTNSYPSPTQYLIMELYYELQKIRKAEWENLAWPSKLLTRVFEPDYHFEVFSETFFITTSFFLRDPMCEFPVLDYTENVQKFRGYEIRERIRKSFGSSDGRSPRLLFLRVKIPLIVLNLPTFVHSFESDGNTYNLISLIAYGESTEDYLILMKRQNNWFCLKRGMLKMQKATTDIVDIKYKAETVLFEKNCDN